jgi:predicted Zn-dependent protease
MALATSEPDFVANRITTMRKLAFGFILAVTTAACGISTQQEVQMGAEYSAQINAQLPIVQDAEINRYVNVLGDSLARLADPRGLDYSFYVVNAAEVNAFAVPGGYIYVNRGLIDRAQNLSQLAGVLGHEIGHVVRRHSVQQMEKAQGANIGVILGCTLINVCNNPAAEAAINLGGTALFAKFSRDDERESDRDAVATLVRAGIHPQGIPQMFEILLNERNNNNAAVAGWFSSHPGEEDRIRETSALIQQIDPAILRTLTTNSNNFASFKARVRSLPAPPRTASSR